MAMIFQSERKIAAPQNPEKRNGAESNSRESACEYIIKTKEQIKLTFLSTNLYY